MATNSKLNCIKLRLSRRWDHQVTMNLKWPKGCNTSRLVCFYFLLRYVARSYYTELHSPKLRQTHMASGTSGQWLWYLHGAKDVLMNTLHPVKQTFIDEQLLLYQWTYYTFVLAKFALRHWRNADKVQQKLNRPMGEAVGEGECQRAFRQAEVRTYQ